MIIWDEPAVAKLRELHAEGLSARQISIQFGVTRNAVVGKLHRLGLVGNWKKPEGYPQRPKKKGRARGQIYISRLGKRCTPLPPVSGDPATMVLCDIMKLERRSCRFPIGDNAPYLFCGNQTDDWELPYCAHHMRIVYKRTEELDYAEAAE